MNYKISKYLLEFSIKLKWLYTKPDYLEWDIKEYFAHYTANIIEHIACRLYNENR